MKRELQEGQRYGRNKDTSINHAYINSGEYRKKFDAISNNSELNRKVYQLAKKMLEHRSGTAIEDMYWLDIDTLEIVASETMQKQEHSIRYSKSTKKVIANKCHLLAIHTHPNSMPPSISDFNACLKNHYEIGIICGHNGNVFLYKAVRSVLEPIYIRTIAKYRRMGYNEFDSQMKTIEVYKENGDIFCKEV